MEDEGVTANSVTNEDSAQFEYILSNLRLGAHIGRAGGNVPESKQSYKQLLEEVVGCNIAESDISIPGLFDTTTSTQHQQNSANFRSFLGTCIDSDEEQPQQAHYAAAKDTVPIKPVSKVGRPKGSTNKEKPLYRPPDCVNDDEQRLLAQYKECKVRMSRSRAAHDTTSRQPENKAFRVFGTSLGTGKVRSMTPQMENVLAKIVDFLEKEEDVGGWKI